MLGRSDDVNSGTAGGIGAERKLFGTFSLLSELVDPADIVADFCAGA